MTLHVCKGGVGLCVRTYIISCLVFVCDDEILGEVVELIFPEREKKLVRERDSSIAYPKKLQ